MTTISEPLPHLSPEEAAEAIVALRLGDRPYDSELRRLAEKAIVDYAPAYIQLTDLADTKANRLCLWALGGKTGNLGLDPLRPIYGLRQVLDHLEHVVSPEEMRGYLDATRNVQPINAMAILDTELMKIERAITAGIQREVEGKGEPA